MHDAPKQISFISYAAHKLIRAICTGTPDKGSGKLRKSIQICCDLVGFISLDELMKRKRHDPKVMPFPVI